VATTTLYPTANSGALFSYDAAYANARAGTGTLAVQGAGDARIGQRLTTDPTYQVWQYELEFDLASIAGATISAAILSLFVTAVDGTPGYVIEVRMHDYGTSITTADFVAGASLSSKTLVAQWTSANPDTEYKTFTDVAMPANLVAGSLNRMILVGARQTSNNAPTDAEYITAYYDNTGGDPTRPKLDITYTAGGGPAGAREMTLLGVGR
jgi:hypothetical protein